MNHENLRLMERINQLENEKKEKSDGNSILIKVNSMEPSFDEKLTKMDEMTYINELNSKLPLYKSMAGRMNGNNNNNSNSINNQSINITEIIEDNDYLKEKFENLKILKEKLKLTKKENKFLSTEIANMNTQSFYLAKIFTEGFHELSKELLKIHEIQLDKVVQSKLKND